MLAPWRRDSAGYLDNAIKADHPNRTRIMSCKLGWTHAMSAARNISRNAETLLRSTALTLLVIVAGCVDQTDFNVFNSKVVLHHLRVRARDGSVIWEISQPKAPIAVGRVAYGSVPAGFVQLTSVARPRPLIRGETLTVMLVTANTVICVHGHALNSRSFVQDVYETIPSIAQTAKGKAELDRIEQCNP
jgi:hypothetical protein